MKTSSKKKNKVIQSKGYFDWNNVIFFVLGIGFALLISTLINVKYAKPNNTIIAASEYNPKTWANWEYTTIKLERPDDSLPKNDPPPMDIIWIFENYTAPQLEEFFKSCGLPSELEEKLLTKTNWFVQPNYIQIRPPIEVVRDMPIESRKKIYNVLRKNPANFFHHNPFQLNSSEFDEWLAQSGLSPQNQELFKRVIWKEGDTYYFADYQLLESYSSYQEKRKVAKSLSRVPALIMNLRITPQTDIDAVVRYFENGGRGREMKSFLESIARIPEGRSISVSFFLPTFARMRLYTYPNVKQEDIEAGKKLPDCFWSSMNFFNEVPDDRFFDPAFIQQTLRSEYSMVSSNFLFGDLILIISHNDQATHMCVYIADDVVFTKNGAQPLQPWVLMKLQDVVKIYTTDLPVRVIGYRRRG